MAWIYLAESEDSVSPWLPGCGRSPIVRTTPTHSLCSCLESPMGNSLARRSGTTLHRLLAPCYRLSTLSTADSPAKISALQALELAWRESEVDFILKSKGLSKNQSQLSFFLKTSLRSGHADLVVWCGDFPSSGMIADGQLFRPPKLEPSISVSDGSYLPTPTAKHYGSNRGGGGGRVGHSRHSIHQLATRGLLPNHSRGALNRNYLELVMGYPLQWTEIAPWATQWYRSKRKRRSKD